MNDEDAARTHDEEDVQEDLELRADDANQVVGGATVTSLDPPPTPKYDLKGTKGG